MSPTLIRRRRASDSPNPSHTEYGLEQQTLDGSIVRVAVWTGSPLSEATRAQMAVDLMELAAHFNQLHHAPTATAQAMTASTVEEAETLKEVAERQIGTKLDSEGH